MTQSSHREWHVQVALGKIAGARSIKKYGRNPSIDTTSGFEAIWSGGGNYTGFCAVAEPLEVFSSSANDVGTLLSSGVASAGSFTTLIDTGATFVSDGVSVGDVLINDSLPDHGIVIEPITETTLTIRRMIRNSKNNLGSAYRIVTRASTGCPVVGVSILLDENFVEQKPEYIILNGATPVVHSNGER